LESLEYAAMRAVGGILQHHLAVAYLKALVRQLVGPKAVDRFFRFCCCKLGATKGGLYALEPLVNIFELWQLDREYSCNLINPLPFLWFESLAALRLSNIF
jgi:hypothetical protein